MGGWRVSLSLSLSVLYLVTILHVLPISLSFVIFLSPLLKSHLPPPVSECFCLLIHLFIFRFFLLFIYISSLLSTSFFIYTSSLSFYSQFFFSKSMYIISTISFPFCYYFYNYYYLITLISSCRGHFRGSYRINTSNIKSNLASRKVYSSK